MKMFISADVDEAQIMPEARIAYVRIMSRDTIVCRRVIVRTPFRRWVKYVDPWSFGPTSGWCTFSFMVEYRLRARKVRWMTVWRPVDLSTG